MTFSLSTSGRTSHRWEQCRRVPQAVRNHSTLVKSFGIHRRTHVRTVRWLLNTTRARRCSLRVVASTYASTFNAAVWRPKTSRGRTRSLYFASANGSWTVIVMMSVALRGLTSPLLQYLAIKTSASASKADLRDTPKRYASEQKNHVFGAYTSVVINAMGVNAYRRKLAVWREMLPE